jgi:hypothetical protein
LEDREVILFSVEKRLTDEAWSSITGDDDSPLLFQNFESAKARFDEEVSGGNPGNSFRVIAHEYESTFSKIVIEKQVRLEMICLVCKATHFEHGDETRCPYCGNDDVSKNVYAARGDA